MTDARAYIMCEPRWRPPVAGRERLTWLSIRDVFNPSDETIIHQDGIWGTETKEAKEIGRWLIIDPDKLRAE